MPCADGRPRAARPSPAARLKRVAGPLRPSGESALPSLNQVKRDVYGSLPINRGHSRARAAGAPRVRDASAAEPRPRPAGTSVAATPGATTAPRPNAGVVAIAIGELYEFDGAEAIVDLHAVINDGQAGGNLRFYSEEYGSYNGGVQTLSVTGGVIRATGGGGLLQTDGRRAFVTYTAEITVATKHANLSVRNRDQTYTMVGTLDGFILAGSPPA